ncbi:MAG TPA: HAMP domain-containing histidine kinase, partial [Anaerolineae bacterium]|nr:HAMP domain-containing histidine kinase [Anaerolineae bacterium]
AGFTDLLLSETMGLLGSKQRDLLQRVKANTERMNGLLDQLLQVATGDTQPPHPAEEMVDVRAVVETAVNGVITQVREKNLHLDLEIDPDLPPLAVDQTALYQIMTHLLSNACQASHNDGRVTITAHAHTIPDSPTSINDRIEFLQVNIKDSGNGIRQEDLSYVFDAQYKAEHPLIAGLGDTGAGLSVAQSLAAANGGRLWVESEIGEGSTFSVLFPVTTKVHENGHDNGELRHERPVERPEIQ